MSAPRATAARLCVIGLEVHCQLATRTKLFCGCKNQFGAPPNTLVCALCSGAPGSLPVVNEQAVRLALRAALALGCTIDRSSRFERKHYFYCDLPKGYQISQYARPIATGGGIELGSGRLVRLRRLHIEEDAGKAIHDRGPHTLVDLNRAGVPLIEIVSEPDLTSSAEATEYLERLKERLVYTGVSECDMEKGSLRCDVNVSLHRRGEPWGTRVELKNLNSFKSVAQALEHETERQEWLLASGMRVRQETRLWDAERSETRLMRSKEDEQDYRYFPDPDLPPLSLSETEVERERAALPEPPAARRERWQRELGLSAYDAGVLSASREMAELFEATARLSGEPKEAANWIANDLAAALAESGQRSPAALGLSAARLAELITLVQRGTLHRGAAKAVLAAMLKSSEPAAALVQRLGLAQVSDGAAIEDWCRDALRQNAKVAADVRAGQLKALGALIGPVMKASGGRANPEVVQSVLLRLIQEQSP